MAAYDFGKMGKGNGSSKYPAFDPESTAVVEQHSRVRYWQVGELANPADLPTPKGETRIKNPNSTVGVHGHLHGGKEVFYTLTFKDINRETGEVESLTIQKLPEREFFRLSEIPEKVRTYVADRLDNMAHANGVRNGLSHALIDRIVKGEDVSLADSLAGEALNQELAGILTKDAADFYEKKADALLDEAIDSRDPALVQKAKQASGEAKSIRAAGEVRSLPKGNPLRNKAEQQDEQTLSSSGWQEKERLAREQNGKGGRNR